MGLLARYRAWRDRHRFEKLVRALELHEAQQRDKEEEEARRRRECNPDAGSHE